MVIQEKQMEQLSQNKNKHTLTHTHIYNNKKN